MRSFLKCDQSLKPLLLADYSISPGQFLRYILYSCYSASEYHSAIFRYNLWIKQDIVLMLNYKSCSHENPSLHTPDCFITVY